MRHLKRQRVAARRGRVSINFPELFWNKCFDFAFTLNHQTHSHRLYATGRQTTRNFFPQQWRHHIAHNTVHKAARLLRINTIDVQLARFFKRLANSIFGNFVKHHAAVAGVVATDDFPQVPCNGFPFAVKVGCEIDVVGFFSQLLQFRNNFLFTRQHFIARIPVVPRVNTHTVDESATFILFGLFSRFGGG